MLVKKISIGFSYDQAPSSQGISELIEAEYEDEKTLNWLRNTLSGYGKVIDIIWGPDVLSQICSIKPDVIFNITEASGSRNRESLLPALAESAGISCTGSDAVAMGISLDKFITKVVASYIGIPTPRCVLIDDPFLADADIVLKADLEYPVIVKPNTGGSSMGIYQTSKVLAKEKVMDVAKQIYNKYRGKILIEEFIPGREYTAALLEKDGLMTLPLAEIQLYGNTEQDFYSLEIKSRHEKTIICPCSIDNKVETSMNDYKGKRLCIVLKQSICSPCCGKKRGNEIKCTLECSIYKKGLLTDNEKAILDLAKESFNDKFNDFFIQSGIPEIAGPFEEFVFINYYGDPSIDDNDILNCYIKIYHILEGQDWLYSIENFELDIYWPKS